MAKSKTTKTKVPTQKAVKAYVEAAVSEPIKEKKEAAYTLEASVNDVVFKTKANSIEEALTKFVKSPEFPHGSKTKLFLKYSKGKVVRQRFWHTAMARRLLMTIAIKPSAISVLADQLNRSLNE